MKIRILNTSHLSLIRLAALVWYIGVLVLAVKSSHLMLEAYNGRVIEYEGSALRCSGPLGATPQANVTTHFLT